jgi:hypothetical protein
MGAEKGGGLRGGFRVFKLHVSSENLPRLRQLFRDFVDGRTRVKGALYYREEWLEEWGNVLKMREEAGRRTMPKPPAALLLELLPEEVLRSLTVERAGELSSPELHEPRKSASTTRSSRGWLRGCAGS